MKSNAFFYTLAIIICLSFANHTVHGQHTSVLGRFDVDIVKGCTGLIVNITENGTFDTPQYWHEGFDDNVVGSSDLFFEYNNAGEYYLTQTVNDNDLEDKDSLLITVIESKAPEFTIHNCANHQVSVEINENFYDRYWVKFTDSDSTLVDTLSFSDPFPFGVQTSARIFVRGILDGGADNCRPLDKTINTINQIIAPVITSVESIANGNSEEIQLVHTLGSDIIYNLRSSTNGSSNFDSLQQVDAAETTLDSLDTKNDFFCYQIDTYDACNQEIIPSNIVCSVKFNVSASEDGNSLNWETDSTRVLSYNVLRNDGLLINIQDPLATNFVDTAVICKNQYIYNVQPLFAIGTSLGVDTAVVASQSGDLPAITSYPTSTILNQGVVLNWGLPDTGEIPFRKYIIQKNINDRGWRLAGTSNDTTFTDLNASFNGSLSYQITYDDECDNIAAPSPSTTPVIIRQLSARGKEVRYGWNQYETWLQGIRNYTVERVDTAGNIIEEYPVLSGREKSIEFSSNDLNDKYIRIRAESLDDTPFFTYSNIILTTLETEMYLPTAFTPDQDGINDKFFAKGPAVFNFSMEVFNRWGVLIFATTDNINGWDGTIQGNNSPEGTYIYKIYFEDGEGRKFDQSGAFVLIRKRNP